MKTKIIALVGASGCGKTTIAEELTKDGELVKVVTDTTREPRKNEVDGVDYNFIDEKKFRHEDYLESTYYAGNYYGTRRGEIEKIITDGKTPVLILDANGVKSLEREYGKDAVISIYIERNSEDVLAAINARRITEEEKKQRLEQLTDDWKALSICKIRVFNSKIKTSVAEIRFILTAEGVLCGNKEGA